MEDQKNRFEPFTVVRFSVLAKHMTSLKMPTMADLSFQIYVVVFEIIDFQFQAEVNKCRFVMVSSQ